MLRELLIRVTPVVRPSRDDAGVPGCYRVSFDRPCPVDEAADAALALFHAAFAVATPGAFDYEVRAGDAVLFGRGEPYQSGIRGTVRRASE